ncbi:unnamed protein product [Paramecium sonneborni]|uniref:Uncharacterized protein n=1 Tax=Paramecium sonneborni TaxID=65129 RepID=A0A8S1NQR8_9CILI|nr:unnamed protein product [Paramecium sonneborni]
MIKGVLTKSHGIVIITMTGLFTQAHWTFSTLQFSQQKPNDFQKDFLQYQMAHFINYSISGFFFPITTSILLSGLLILRQYNYYINYEQDKQKYFKYAQMSIIGCTSLLGLSVPSRYILLNKHR